MTLKYYFYNLQGINGKHYLQHMSRNSVDHGPLTTGIIFSNHFSAFELLLH